MIWLTPYIQVPKPEDGAQLRYSQEAVDQVMGFFSLLVFGQNEWAGKPFTLLPWEEQAIREFYGVQVLDDDGNWVRYRRFLYDEIAKKNGKSEFAARSGAAPPAGGRGGPAPGGHLRRPTRPTRISSTSAPSTWWNTPH